MKLVKLPMLSYLPSNLKLPAFTLLLLVIASCSHERPVYHGAEYYKNLEVPPDLTAPDTADQLKVPSPTKEAMQRFRDNNKLETILTPKFDGVRMVSYAGNSWLEVDNNVEKVWPRLLEFWQIEGITLVQVRPRLGFMETDWTARLGGEVGAFKAFFQSFEPDQKDKFRVRVERFDAGNKTRLYISHSRIEKIIHGEYAEDFTWVSLPSDIEAERELISRMALFAGLDKDQSSQLIENYRPYSSLIKTDRTHTAAFTMTGSMDFVWRRAMRALDRMSMQDIREQQENNTIYFVVAKLSDEDLNVEQDDLSDSSWIMQLLTSNEDDVAANKSRHYRLEFTTAEGSIQVEVKDARNSKDTDEDGDVYSTALAEQLRDMLVKRME
jgi:outer membrane protein assembly factor BamC